VTPAGPGQIACLIGEKPLRTIALITIDTQRITSRITFDKGTITSLASSPDGRTLFCAADNMVWKIPTSGGEPEKMIEGQSISVDPDGRHLIVQVIETARSRLFRVPLNGGQKQEITLEGPFELSTRGIGPQAIRSGRVLVVLNAADSWNNTAGMIDLDTGHVTRWKLDYSGDFQGLAWTGDGQITAIAFGTRSDLWKFQPRTSKK
jgi:WD40 repeat protein